MERKQDYTPEFRAEAVKLVLAQGLSLGEAAKRLSLPKGTLGHWVANAKAPTGPAAPGARTVGELEAEVRQRRKELAEAGVLGSMEQKTGLRDCAPGPLRFRDDRQPLCAGRLDWLGASSRTLLASG